MMENRGKSNKDECNEEEKIKDIDDNNDSDDN